MSCDHHPKPMLDEVAVISGWKSSDSQVTCVSCPSAQHYVPSRWPTPEKPMGYRWLPGPAYRLNVIGRPCRLLSMKWKWFSIHKGSTFGILVYRPCCQSSHQKSTPSSSSGWWTTLKYASKNFLSVQSNGIGLESQQR